MNSDVKYAYDAIAKAQAETNRIESDISRQESEKQKLERKYTQRKREAAKDTFDQDGNLIDAAHEALSAKELQVQIRDVNRKIKELQNQKIRIEREIKKVNKLITRTENWVERLKAATNSLFNSF